MDQNSNFTVKSTIEFNFKDSDTRDYSYNSFLPELNKLKSHRSTIDMNKTENSLIFTVISTDITAFRAAVSDIISLGKIIDSSLILSQE